MQFMVIVRVTDSGTPTLQPIEAESKEAAAEAYARHAYEFIIVAEEARGTGVDLLDIETVLAHRRSGGDMSKFRLPAILVDKVYGDDGGVIHLLPKGVRCHYVEEEDGPVAA
ncbi:MAG: hypothetical protein EPN36_14430 [Rhodanobacteraceae bacterium]|nr:MAG: hypothetical protein EPN36_14430 [Rhodanobacteraceae bacterium]